MERARVDQKEITRLLDEDYYAALNMIGEGGPDYAAIEDDAPEEVKRDAKKAEELH